MGCDSIGLIIIYAPAGLLFLFTFFGQVDRSILICSGFLKSAGIPVIQVVGNIVAITALGESGQHASRMWRTMATLASRHELMFFLMAGYACHSLMFGIAGSQKLMSFFVTGTTHFIRGIRWIGNSSRHMSLMTALAICGGHFWAVWFMTLGTLGDLAVYIMAEATGQFGVFARSLLQLHNLLSMTGKAFIGNIISKLDNFRCMRIGVTAQTPGQVIVRFTTMTLVALGNDFSDNRRMAGMAILTRNLALVGATISCNSLGSCRVTLDAICAGQHGFLRFCCHSCHRKRSRKNGCHENSLQTKHQSLHHFSSTGLI